MKNLNGCKGLVLAGVLFAVVGATIGCVDYNNRPPPSQAEVKQADQKRQSYIDTIPNLTPEQRAQMKSHLGGPAAGQAAPTDRK